MGMMLESRRLQRRSRRAETSRHAELFAVLSYLPWLSAFYFQQQCTLVLRGRRRRRRRRRLRHGRRRRHGYHRSRRLCRYRPYRRQSRSYRRHRHLRHTYREEGTYRAAS